MGLCAGPDFAEAGYKIRQGPAQKAARANEGLVVDIREHQASVTEPETKPALVQL